MLSSNLKAAHNSHPPNSVFPPEFPQHKKMQTLYRKLLFWVNIMEKSKYNGCFLCYFYIAILLHWSNFLGF